MVIVFKEGDHIKMRRSCSGALKGYVYELKKDGGDLFAFEGNKELCSCPQNWELVDSSNQNMQHQINTNSYAIAYDGICAGQTMVPATVANTIKLTPKMSLKSIYRNLTRTEPQRTFVKAGVCDNEGFLTPDGKELFLAYLLEQYGEAFKKDVVDAIAEEKSQNPDKY